MFDRILIKICKYILMIPQSTQTFVENDFDFYAMKKRSTFTQWRVICQSPPFVYYLGQDGTFSLEVLFIEQWANS